MNVVIQICRYPISVNMSLFLFHNEQIKPLKIICCGCFRIKRLNFLKLQYMVFLLLFMVMDIVYVSLFAVLLTNVSAEFDCFDNAQTAVAA